MKHMMAAFIAIVASVLLVGCANRPVSSATKFTSYEDFRPGPEGGVDLVWARIGMRDKARLQKEIAQYDSVVFDRVLVVVDNAELSNDEIDEVTQYLLQELREKISPYKKIVTKPEENTLRVSIAISNVETPNPVLAATSSILPIGLGISAISKVTTGEHTNVGRATIELLVSDAKNDKPLFAAIDRQSGNKDISTMIDSLDDIKEVVSWWVERLGITLDSAAIETS